jgi:hypothetical protein
MTFSLFNPIHCCPEPDDDCDIFATGEKIYIDGRVFFPGNPIDLGGLPNIYRDLLLEMGRDPNEYLNPGILQVGAFGGAGRFTCALFDVALLIVAWWDIPGSDESTRQYNVDKLKKWLKNSGRRLLWFPYFTPPGENIPLFERLGITVTFGENLSGYPHYIHSLVEGTDAPTKCYFRDYAGWIIDSTFWTTFRRDHYLETDVGFVNIVGGGIGNFTGWQNNYHCNAPLPFDCLFSQANCDPAYTFQNLIDDVEVKDYAWYACRQFFTEALRCYVDLGGGEVGVGSDALPTHNCGPLPYTFVGSYPPINYLIAGTTVTTPSLYQDAPFSSHYLGNGLTYWYRYSGTFSSGPIYCQPTYQFEHKEFLPRSECKYNVVETWQSAGDANYAAIVQRAIENLDPDNDPDNPAFWPENFEDLNGFIRLGCPVGPNGYFGCGLGPENCFGCRPNCADNSCCSPGYGDFCDIGSVDGFGPDPVMILDKYGKSEVIAFGTTTCLMDPPAAHLATTIGISNFLLFPSGIVDYLRPGPLTLNKPFFRRCYPVVSSFGTLPVQ